LTAQQDHVRPGLELVSKLAHLALDKKRPEALFLRSFPAFIGLRWICLMVPGKGFAKSPESRVNA
jgi:hypothetical protein